MKFTGSFGDWLKLRRRALDLTQTELADQVGCSVAMIRKIEGDGARPSKQIAERLADVLAISMDERAGFVAFARRTASDLPASPVPNSPHASSHNLPVQSTSFIGRTRELAQITERLADPECRLLTIVGVGGVGKTRLALQAAAEQIDNFRDGVYFVSLAAVGSPGLLASSIAGALQVTFYGTDDPDTQIVNYLREKHMLLVLDNFEHLLAATPLLTNILGAAPLVKILVTSRERLNLEEEWVSGIDGLRFPTGAAADSLETYSAVQLFVQRARQIQANFSLIENTESVIAICQHVEGMPLGIELAATWLRLMSCHEIVAQLDRGLDFLVTPLRNVPERHRSLRAVFEQSWKLLSDNERSVLAALSIFQGGFDLESASHVAGAALSELARLADKSLIRMNPPDRYDLHELLRQYVYDKLVESGELERIRHRHLAYFLRLAEQSEAHLYGPDQISWFDRLELEQGNLRVALAWSLESGTVESGLRLAGALGWFWELRAHCAEGAEWLERLLALATNVPASIRAKALHQAGNLVGFFAYSGRARELCEEGLALARSADDKLNAAWSLAMLGFRTEVYFDFNRSALLLEEAMALFRELDDPWGLSHSLRRRAWLALDQRDYEYASRLMEEALARSRAAGDETTQAWALYILGVAAWYHHRAPAQTIVLFRASQALFQEICEMAGLLLALNSLADVMRFQGNNVQSLKLYKQTLVQVQVLGGYRRINVFALAGLGGLFGLQGKPGPAARLLGAAEDAYKSERQHFPLNDQARIASDVASARAQLGEVAFARAWSEGKAMTLEQATAYALDQLADIGSQID